jgi:putative NIF3 family GTP cyclohydrolase 1 type 2
LATPSQLETHMVSLFDAGQLEQAPDEWGFTWVNDRPVRRMGYCTNLTPEVAQEAVSEGVALVLTHHDAWPFLYGMRERCMEMLRPEGISHCFFHAPLDAADFGTSASLARRLGLRVTGRCLAYRDMFLTGEKVLYTVEYARFAGINLLVGSHTATELPGVEALARMVADDCGIEAVRLTEAHRE